MYTYYFKYVQGDAGLMSLYNLVGLVPLVAGCYLFKAWYNVDGNKGRVTAYGCIGAGIAMILMRFTSPIGSPVLFYALCAISKFFEGVLASGIYGVIPDTVEYGQLKTGVQTTAFCLHLSRWEINLALHWAVPAWRPFWQFWGSKRM